MKIPVFTDCINLPRASTTPQEQPFILSQGSGHTPHRSPPSHLHSHSQLTLPRKEPRCRNLLCLHTHSTPVHLHTLPRAFLCTYFPSAPVHFLRGFVFLELQCSSLPSVRTVLIGFFLPFLQLLTPPTPIQSQVFRAMEGVLFHSSGCWRNSFPGGGVGCSKGRLAENPSL